jgi:hypothetical protein
MFPRFHATKRYELIEVNIPAASTQTRFNIPDQPQLRTDQDADVIIQAIEVFDSLAINPSPNNAPVATAVNLLQAYLILYIEGEESIYRIPFNQLKRVAQEGAAVPYTWDLARFKNIQVDFTKSYIFTPLAFTGLPFSFLFGIHYMKLPPGTMANINKAELANFANVRVPVQ